MGWGYTIQRITLYVKGASLCAANPQKKKEEKRKKKRVSRGFEHRQELNYNTCPRTEQQALMQT